MKYCVTDKYGVVDTFISIWAQVSIFTGLV